MTAINKTVTPAEGDIFITRIFDAPRQLVFNAWVDVEHLKNWYAPEGCSINFEHINVKNGGTFHSVIRTPTGYVCWCTGTYMEVTPFERIIFTMTNADEQGRPLTAEDAGKDPEWPVETIVTLTFEEIEAGKTKFTLHQTASQEVAKRTGAYQGWEQMLDNLAVLVEQ
ncbi:MAG: SRPBCC domain-containing protein [Chitinophagaceae bacterium]|nr:MAG: SRPBCC domain-containing protein [Chitinophagaceae bacterium]